MFKVLIIFSALVCLQGCDQFGNRFEISKDQKGRTVRLDKRTGDIAIVDNDTLINVKDAKEIERKQADAMRQAELPKSWPILNIPQIRMQATLQTTWRDGKVLYAISFTPQSSLVLVPVDKEGKTVEAEPRQEELRVRLSATDVEAIVRAALLKRYFLIFEDVPFELANQQLTLSSVVNDAGKLIGLDSKGQIVMSLETYEKAVAWNIQWRG